MTSLSPQHICICDECSPVPYADKCQYETRVEELKDELRECWSFKDEQSTGVRYRKTLETIAERGCRHCSAGDRALSAMGATYYSAHPDGDPIELVKKERDAARALADQAERLVKQFRKGLKSGAMNDLAYNWLAAYEARDWK